MIKLTLLLLALVAANMPWFSERLFYVISLGIPTKHFAWCLLELIVMYFVIGAIAIYAESTEIGQSATQHWEFYATTACMFLVFSFPGFVYRFFWKRQIQA